MAGVFLLSTERWKASCGIWVFVCAICAKVHVCIPAGFFAVQARMIQHTSPMLVLVSFILSCCCISLILSMWKIAKPELQETVKVEVPAADQRDS